MKRKYITPILSLEKDYMARFPLNQLQIFPTFQVSPRSVLPLLLIMASTKKHLLSLPQAFASLSDIKYKPRTKPLALKAIQENDFLHTSADFTQAKARRKSSELRATSPYAATTSALLRSKSVVKSAWKGEVQAGVKAGHRRTESSLTKAALKVRLRKKLSCSQSFSLKDGFKAEDRFESSFADFRESPRPTREPISTFSLRNIEEMMNKGLIEAKGLDWKAEMRIYSKALNNIGAIEGSLGAILGKIRGKLEILLQSLAEKLTSEASKSQAQITTLQANLIKEIEEKRLLKRKFEKIARENVELTQSCDSFQQQCYDLQAKLQSIASVTLDNYPPSEASWRLLVAELGNYREWKETAGREIRIAQSKEKKLLSLLNAIKKHGFPVEEVYESEIRKSVVRPSLPESGDLESESEALATGPAPVRPRPTQVPALPLDSVEPDLSSESSYETESEALELESAASREKQTQDSSGPSTESKAEVPKLKLPLGKADFHQEFMSRYGEFSESWRKAIDAEKKF